MKKLLQVSLLASAVLVGLSGCKEEQASAPAPAAEKTAPELTSFEAKSAYAIGLSMGRYIGSTLEKQQELGVELDNDTILRGVKDGFSDAGQMSDEEIQAALTAYDEHINGLIETQAREQAATTLEEGNKFLEDNAKRDGVKVTESGLQYQVLTEGEGAKPAAEDVVTVHYTGTLVDGTTFDSSVERGEPASFPLNQVIPGWTEGVQLMPVGSKYKLFIPAELGYGESGAGSIPGNAVLVFEVELLDIKVANQPEVAAVPEAQAVEPEAPAVEPEAPAVESEAPAAESEAPAAESEAPAAESEAPAAESKTPAVE